MRHRLFGLLLMSFSTVINANTLGFYVNCERDPNALEQHWDTIRHEALDRHARVRYRVSGECRFSYRDWHQGDLSIVGSATDKATLIGSFTLEGKASKLSLKNLIIRSNGREKVKGEHIRPSHGAKLTLENVDTRTINVSAWDKTTELNIIAGELGDVSLHNAKLVARNASMHSLHAENSEFHLHDGSVAGMLSAVNSLGSVQVDVAHRGISGIGDLHAANSMLMFTETNVDQVHVNAGSDVMFSGGSIGSMSISSSQVELSGIDKLTRGAMMLMAGASISVQTNAPTQIQYMCDMDSMVMGDSSTSAQRCQ